MKIAMLIDGWKPIFGGGQIHVKELCNGLIKNHNCKIDLFVRKLKDDNGKKYDKNENLQNGKLKIFRVGPTTKFFNIFGRIFSLINITFFLLIKAKKEKYDIIHAHAYVSGLPAKIVGKFFKIPVIYTVHGTMGLDTGKKGLMYYFEDYLINKLKYDLEISVSKNIFKYSPFSKVKIIYNGVNLDKFNKIKIDKKYDGLNFLWVGRFSWQKGLEYLIKGLSLVDRKLLKEKGFKLNLVGDGEDKEKIESLVKKNQLEEFVNFKGKIFGYDLIKEYKKNHIFILPSLAEGQPLTVLEAFASKILVIATDVGDNKYFVNENNGFLMKLQNEKEIKKIIEKVLQFDKEKLSLLGEFGYKLVQENYSWDKMVEKVFSCYKKYYKYDIK